MTTGFDLKNPSLPAHLLRQIVQKFDFNTGIKFYSTCKDAKEFVEEFKYSWPLEEAQLYYTFNKRRLQWNGTKKIRFLTLADSKMLEFVKINSIIIQGCEQEYLEEVVIPEISKLKAVSRLFLRKSTTVDLPDNFIGQIIRAARPNCLSLQDKEFDYHNPHFKNVRNLDLLAFPLKDFENILFEVGMTRKSISFGYVRDFTPFLQKLIQTWKEGKPTGSLEILTIYGWKNKTEFKILFEQMECQETNSGNYKLKRKEISGERNEIWIREVDEVSRANIQMKFI